MKKLVFFIGDLSHSGGTERVLAEIANGLCERGYDVSIVSLTGEAPAFFQFDERIRIHWLKSRSLQSDIVGNLRQLEQIYRSEKPDLWIDVDIILCVYSLLLKLRHRDMKLVSWEHFNYYYPFPVNQGLRKIVRRLVARFSDCLLVLSKEDMGYYQENLNVRGLLRQIYNPAPFENQPPKEHDNKIILAAGRLTDVKGFDMLIESWALLEEKYPDWKVIVAGDGEDREKLEQLKAEKGLQNISFIGRVENIQDYYRDASFFVLPSRGEGFVMVLLEAMAFSNPVVAFTCKAGVAELVSEGMNGYPVPLGDTVKFAQKMENLMCSDILRSTMGENARARMEEFSHREILNRWEMLMKELDD